MVTMTQLPVRHTWTRHDLELMPDDGNRYELIDGVLIVSPAPGHAHQRAAVRLTVLLDSVCPDGCEVLIAPFDVVLDDLSVMEPDVLVARTDTITRRNLPVPPLVAVEIISPSSRMIDLHVKKDRLRRAGCPHYWVVDPDEPSITAWTWHDAMGKPVYDLVGRARGGETLRLTEPFPVDIVPARLV